VKNLTVIEGVLSHPAVLACPEIQERKYQPGKYQAGLALLMSPSQKALTAVRKSLVKKVGKNVRRIGRSKVKISDEMARKRQSSGMTIAETRKLDLAPWPLN
jgi:hypothetical protein